MYMRRYLFYFIISPTIFSQFNIVFKNFLQNSLCFYQDENMLLDYQIDI